MKKFVLLILVLGFVIPLSSCAPDPTLGLFLSGTSWQLVEMEVDDVPFGSVLVGRPIVLSFGHGWAIKGETACGRYAGTYEVDGLEFRVTDLEITNSWLSSRKCPQQKPSTRDVAYLEVLADITTARLDTDLWLLILKTDDGGLLAFGLAQPS